jgi:UDP-N-acetylmuramoyl-L-alanyl-D-glutamate--2,6-diaminopimelate ligase
LNLPGLYNVANALAAYSAGKALRLPVAALRRGLASFRGLTGRFEEIKEGQPFRVIVDFAHTPCALKQVLVLISKIKNQKSKVICVFGCAGERDRGKRPMMGEIAGRLADVSLLTAEDPRREDVNKIIEQMAVGCRLAGAYEIPWRGVVNSKFKVQSSKLKKNVFMRVPDRRQAIVMAAKAARPGDLVLITGKGHEKSMCYGTTEYPWSDQAAAREALKGRNATNFLHHAKRGNRDA